MPVCQIALEIIDACDDNVAIHQLCGVSAAHRGAGGCSTSISTVGAGCLQARGIVNGTQSDELAEVGTDSFGASSIGVSFVPD